MFKMRTERMTMSMTMSATLVMMVMMQHDALVLQHRSVLSIVAGTVRRDNLQSLHREVAVTLPNSLTSVLPCLRLQLSGLCQCFCCSCMFIFIIIRGQSYIRLIPSSWKPHCYCVFLHRMFSPVHAFHVEASFLIMLSLTARCESAWAAAAAAAAAARAEAEGVVVQVVVMVTVPFADMLKSAPTCQYAKQQRADMQRTRYLPTCQNRAPTC